MIRHPHSTTLLFFITTSILLLLTTTTSAKSTILTGCSSINFSGGASCFVNDVEILPNIHISESGILTNVESSEGCQAACKRFHDCKYFTFRVEKSTNSKSCHLKPAPSDSSSPIMTARQYDSDSKFGYTSGPKECGQQCTEGKEVATGCGASSPSSCGLIGSSVFDASCASTPANNCGKLGYSCCRDCEKEGSCCNTRINGWILTDGTDFDASKWSGVSSEDQCHTLCVKTAGCTHWNYITSESMSFLGGACYLKTYDPVNDPKFEEAESYLTSIIGAVDCSKDYGIRDPTPATTSTPPDVTGNPVEGTCFESKVDINEGQLFKQWGSQNSTMCQELCQQWPGCKFFVYTPSDTGCSLKYTDFGRTAPQDSSEDFVLGPRDCPDAQPAPPVEGCIKSDTDIDSSDAQEMPALHAADCGLKCMWHGDDVCQGWSYLNGLCYIKKSSTPMISKPGVASGVRGCKWPNYGRRVLTIDDILPSAFIVEGCAQQDKDYFGADLESLAGVDTLEVCRHLCLERQDCKALSYSSTEKICKIKWGGQLVDHVGSIAMPRVCPSGCTGDQCTRSTTDFYNTNVMVQPLNGLAQRTLGKPSEWTIKGEMVNFASPSSWQRMAVLVLTDDVKECYISDLISTSAEHNCWEQRASYLPLHLRVQIMGVTSGAHFKGWSNIPWESQATDSSQADGHFELFNQEMTINEADKPNSDHGVFIQPIAGSSQPPSWPSDMITPLNFQDGQYYARLQSLNTPVPTSFSIMFCLTGSDYPVSEICTTPMVVPPYNV